MCRDLGISRPTLYQYLSFLEGTYFIKTIRPYSKGRSVEIRKTPKVYLCDVGLVNRFARLDTGRLFEQSVFQNLRVKGELHYFQKKSGIEIDFILNKEKAFEVKLSVQGSDVSRLERLSHEIGLREYEVVCKNFTPLKEHVTYGYCL
jgi:predicted AAA+ superfamily ATPase